MSASVSAQTNLEKLGSVQTTGTSFADKLIDQGGKKAVQIKKNLEPAQESVPLPRIGKTVFLSIQEAR